MSSLIPAGCLLAVAGVFLAGSSGAQEEVRSVGSSTVSAPQGAASGDVDPQTILFDSSNTVDPFLEHDRQDGIDLLFLRGTAEQRARALGAHQMPQIIELFESFALAEALGLSPLAWGFAVLPKANRVLAPLESHRQHYRDLLAGARDVLGPEALVVPQLRRPLRVDDLMAVTLLPDFMGLGCSSFAAWDREVAGTGPVVGRNLDYFGTDVMLRQTGLVVHAPLGDRAGWVSVGWSGVHGCLTGVSEHGITVAIHDVGSTSKERAVRVTPRVSALRELITRLKPGPKILADAERILEEHRFGYGGNVMLAWAGGEDHEPGAAVIELHAVGDAGSVEDEVVVRTPRSGDDWIACTNHHRVCEHVESCVRYQTVVDVLQPDADPIDAAGARTLIARPEVRSTLYQTITDLERMVLTVRVRRPSDRWDEAVFQVRELIDRAGRGDG